MVDVFGVVIPLSVGGVSRGVVFVFVAISWFFPEAVVVSVLIPVGILLFAAEKRKRLIAQDKLSVGRNGRNGRRRQWRERLVVA